MVRFLLIIGFCFIIVTVGCGEYVVNKKEDVYHLTYESFETGALCGYWYTLDFYREHNLFPTAPATARHCKEEIITLLEEGNE